jgi:peptide/nickel transport system substrate-binding protein
MKVLKFPAHFFLILLLLITVSCTQQTPSASYSKEIVFSVGQMPLNLDPRYATDAASERINRLVYHSLVDFDQQSKPVASLASWVEVSPTVFRFSLNKNRAPFHNQMLLTANDVKATYDSLGTLKDSPNAAEFANVKNIEVINNDTVEFHLNQADKNFPSKLIIGILPAKLIEKGHDFSHVPLGNGVLKFVTWQNKLTLQRVSDGQKISLIEVKDPTVRVLKLLHGEVDLLQGELPPELVKYMQTKPELIVKTSIGVNFSYLGLNFKDPILQNIKIRQAIAHAIDRKKIIVKSMIEQSREADMILPPEHYSNQKSDSTQIDAYEYNPVLAKQLFREAGVKLPLKLVYKTSTDAQRVRFATILQAQMKSSGIDLEIRSLDWGTFFDDVKQGNFQLYGLTWVGIKTPEIYMKAFGSQSAPPIGFNRGRYTDAELDKLLLDENWQATRSRIHNQLPYIPLWYEGQFAAMRKGIVNYNAKPDGNWDDLGTISYAH